MNNQLPGGDNQASLFYKYKKVIGLFLILLLPTTIYFALTTGKHNILHLPYYGNKDVVKVMEDGKEKTDTIYHSIPDFSFTNQLGKTITQKDFEGKIYVTDFFFATCPGICPKMSAQLLRVQEKFEEYPDVMLLSHTVNPEQDTVEALAAYAEMVHANNERWFFVTGNKEDLYKQALYGYLLNASEDILAPGGFLHSEMFVLIDKQRHIRGYYDGTSVKDVNRLIDEIKVLIAEEMIPRKENKQTS